MEEKILNQLFLFIIFIISGIIIGIFFDIFRILRKSFRTSDFVTYIEDILFWIITCIFLIFIIFKFQEGQIRLYDFLGICLGFIFYLICVSKYFININVLIIKKIKKFIKIIFKVFVYPFKSILKPMCFLVINIKKIILFLFEFLNIFFVKKNKNINKNKKDFFI